MMNIRISNERENKLMNRKEIEAMVTYAGKTPSKSELKEELCKKLSLNPDTTLIIGISQEYGVMASNVIAHSYANKESMPAIKERKKVVVEKKDTGMGSAAPEKK